MKYFNKIISVLLIVCMMLPMMTDLRTVVNAATVNLTLDPTYGEIGSNGIGVIVTTSENDTKTFKDQLTAAQEAPEAAGRDFLGWKCDDCGWMMDMSVKINTVTCRNFTAQWSQAYYFINFRIVADASNATFLYECPEAVEGNEKTKDNRLFKVFIGEPIGEQIDIKYIYAKANEDDTRAFAGYVWTTTKTSTKPKEYIQDEDGVYNWDKPIEYFHPKIYYYTGNEADAGETLYFNASWAEAKNTKNLTFDPIFGSLSNNVAGTYKYGLAGNTNGDIMRNTEYFNTLLMDPNVPVGEYPKATAAGFSFVGWFYDNYQLLEAWPWSDEENSNKPIQGYSKISLSDWPTIDTDDSFKAKWNCNAGHALVESKRVNPTCTKEGSDYYECPTCSATVAKNADYENYIINYHAPYTAPIPATGHSWGQWIDQKNGTSKRTCSVCSAAETKNNTYNIAYYDAGELHVSEFSGTTTKENPKTHTFGTATPIEANTASEVKKTGYKFIDWFYNSDCSGDDINTIAKTYYPTSGDTINLYAKWEALTLTINYQRYNASSKISDSNMLKWFGIDGNGIEIKYPGVHTLPVTATYDGYYFAGFYTEKACNNRIYQIDSADYLTDSDEKVTVYVKFVEAAEHTTCEAYSSTYTSPTCTTNGYTTYYCYCGKQHSVVYDDPATTLGHDWGTPTYSWNSTSACTAKRVCKRDASHVEEITATISSKVLTAATCTAKGTTVFTATFSQSWAVTQSKTVDTPALGHAMDGGAVTTKATCTTDGVRTFTCTRSCGHKTTETIAKRNHSMGDWYNVTPATCTGKGQDRRDCKNTTATAEYAVCSHFETREVAINPDNHNWGEATYSWSDDGKSCTAQRICLRDSSHKETVNAGITSVVTAPATCTEMGTTTYTATFDVNWAETQTKSVVDLPALDHDWNPEISYVWSEDNTTCTATRICNRDAVHNLTETVTTTSETVDSTCVGDGNIRYTADFTELWAADQIKDMGIDMDPDKHDLVYHEPKEPTCTEIGWEEYYTCLRCSYTTYKEKTALGHAMDSGVVTTKATCTADGVWSFTCTRNCGYSYTDSIAMRGHDMGDWYTVEEADCTETGLERRDCRNTEPTETHTSCSYFETKVTSATGHTPVVDDAAEPDCTNPGLTEGSHCGVCGVTLVAQEAVDALGHDWKDPVYVWSEDVNGNITCTAFRECKRDSDHKQIALATVTTESEAPSCLKAGYEKHIAVFKEEWAAEQIVTETLDKVDHVYRMSRYLNEVDPTCTEDGSYVEAKVCANCRKIYERITVIVPATGHEWDGGEITRQPTCTTPGELLYTCHNDPSHTRTETIAIDPEAHSWSEGTVILPPTCTEKGISEKTCTLCGTKREFDIDAKGHTPGSEVRENDVYGTCTEEGSYDRVHYCTVCGIEVSRTNNGVHPSLGGHKWVTDGEYGWRVTKEPTYYTPGEETRYCANYPLCGCTESQTRTISVIEDDDAPSVDIGTDLTGVDHKDGAADHTNDPDVVITITADDGENGSGVCYIEYVITKDGERYAAGIYDDNNKPVLTEEGVYTVTATATDNRFNASEPLTIDVIVIDRTLPEINLPENNCAQVNTYCAPDNNTVTAEINESYIENITVKVNGVPDSTLTGKTLVLTGSVEGSIYEITVIDKAGNASTETVIIYSTHNWNDGEITTEAGCTITGVKTYICTRCGASEEEQIPALGHDYSDWIETVSPTCTTPGEEMKYCNRCAHGFGRNTAPLGHDMQAEELFREPAASAAGELRSNCSRNCGHYTAREFSVVNTNGAYSYESVAAAIADGAITTADLYANVHDASLSETVMAGEYLTLLSAVTEEDTVDVTVALTIELNGMAWTVQNLTAQTSGVIDTSEGNIARLVPANKDVAITLNPENTEYPIFDDSEGSYGYYFIENPIKMQQQLSATNMEQGKLKLTFRPVITVEDENGKSLSQESTALTKNYFADGALDERIKIGVIFTVTDKDGNTSDELKWLCSDDLVKVVYNNNRAFEVTLDVSAYASYTIKSVMISDTGVMREGDIIEGDVTVKA